MEGYSRYWRVTSMGNTGISRGTGNKGKKSKPSYTSYTVGEY